MTEHFYLGTIGDGCWFKCMRCGSYKSVLPSSIALLRLRGTDLAVDDTVPCGVG
ncbi:MAG TPA: hypothetical protein VFF30_13325 [Nitrososphaerales archaeon]|nr:hypothetical protein [Nitrososphaerales archaeon]